MLHTGDIYEKRARTARNKELRAVANAISGFLFQTAPRNGAKRTTVFNRPENANDRIEGQDRAA